jgi:PBP1b-binding outer membrane lipoprotein LpoB
MDAPGSAAPSAAPGPVTLRPFLNDRESAAFPGSTANRQDVADVPVDSYEIDLRLHAMKRALVAHQAINKQLSGVGVANLPNSLIESIKLAEELSIVSHAQSKHLRFINNDANEAKHGKGLPF